MMQITHSITKNRKFVPSLASHQNLRFVRFSDDAAGAAAAAAAALASSETAFASPSVSGATEPIAEVPSPQHREQPSASYNYRGHPRHQRYKSGTKERVSRPGQYAVRMTNLTQSVTRSDVARLFSPFSITESDVRPEFQNTTLETEAWWILFHTQEDRRRATALQRSYLGTHRALIRPIDNQQYMYENLRCPLAMNSKGRTLLLENIEISTSLSGIIRHFEGYELQHNGATIINAGKRTREEPAATYDKFERFKASRQLQHNNALTMTTDGPDQHHNKAAWPETPTLRAVVRFATTEEAQRAVRNRNHTFMGNRQIRLRVLP